MSQATIAATYQGLRASDASYVTRSGFAPDDGWVDFDSELANTAELRLKRASLDFFEDAAPPLPMPFSIGALLKTTVAATKPKVDPGKALRFKDFKYVGSLILDSTAGAKPVPIHRVYLHRDAAEDIRKVGQDGGRRTRVRLTDIRQFWPDYGDCYGFVNVYQLTKGRRVWDLRTLDVNNKRYSLSLVLTWLFLHLPGGQFVFGIDKATKGEKPPANVILQHESPFRMLVQLFQRYNLDLQRNLDGTFTVWKRSRLTPSPIKTPAISFQRSLEIKYAPAAARVSGGKIRRNVRGILACASTDLDGKIKPLREVIEKYLGPVDIGFDAAFLDAAREFRADEKFRLLAKRRETDLNIKKIITPMEYVLRQIPGMGDRQYELLKSNPPLLEIAKRDWGKLFQLVTVMGADDQRPSKQIPILDPAMTTGAAAAAKKGLSSFVKALVGSKSLAIAFAAGAFAGAKSFFSSGGFETPIASGSGVDMVRTQKPIVVGDSFGQRLLTKSEILVDAIPDLRRDIQFRVTQATLYLNHYAHERKKVLADIADINTDGKNWEATERVERRVRFDIISEGGEVSPHYTWTKPPEVNRLAQLMETELLLALQTVLKNVEDALSDKEAELKALAVELGSLADLATAIKKDKDIPLKNRLWANLGLKVFSPNDYDITPERGLVRMNAPVGFVTPSFAVNREHFQLVALPTLQILYAVEMDTLTPADEYSALAILTGDAEGAPGTIKLSRKGGFWPTAAEVLEGKQFPVEGSRIPVVPIRAEEIILYVDENGTEFNGGICDFMASQKAAEYFAGSDGGATRQVEGVVFNYEGWHTPADLRGVDSITYSAYDGKPVTTVAHNNRFFTLDVESPARAAALQAARAFAQAAPSGRTEAMRVQP